MCRGGERNERSNGHLKERHDRKDIQVLDPERYTDTLVSRLWNLVSIRSGAINETPKSRLWNLVSIRSVAIKDTPPKPAVEFSLNLDPERSMDAPNSDWPRNGRQDYLDPERSTGPPQKRLISTPGWSGI